MCVLYVSFGSKLRPKSFRCVAMGSAVLFILRSGVKVDLSGFSMRLFCFVHAKTLCMYGCMYFLAVLVLVCVDAIVVPSARSHDLQRCSE